jgi:hypothetical protein
LVELHLEDISIENDDGNSQNKDNILIKDLIEKMVKDKVEEKEKAKE